LRQLEGYKKSEISNLYFLCNKCNEFITYSNKAIYDKISSLQDEIKESLSPISTKLEKIESEFKTSISNLTERVDKIEQSHNDEKSKFLETCTKLKDLETSTEADICELKNKIETLSKKIQESTSEPARVGDSNKITVNNDLTKYRIKISGVPEAPSSLKTNERQEHERSCIKNIFNFMQLENIMLNDSFRLGKFREGSERPRSIIATLSSVWDRNKILQNASLLKDYSAAIFISPALSANDRLLEKKLLKKRWEMINNGIDKKDLKIRNLKLYNKKELVPIADD